MGKARALLALTMTSLLMLPAAAQGRTLRVAPGESIQGAVDAARSGDRIVVARGTYREKGRECPRGSGRKCAVVVRKSGISLVSRGAVLKARRGQYDGIAIFRSQRRGCVRNRRKRLHGATVAGFRIKGFAANGVFLLCVDHWRVTRTRAIGNREYGIFPSHSVNGRVDHSFASGANDTGIYIGQSRVARVDHNTAAGNVSGFEIENSAGIRLDHNTARGNSGGILSFALPGLDVKVNRRNRIERNVVRRNNRRNTCLDPDDTVCKVPRGTGILLLATDRNRVTGNRVTGNRSFGLAMANYCLGVAASPEDCAKIDIDPDPDRNRVLGNTVTGNGLDPAAGDLDAFAGDLVWDLSGEGNCWGDNTAGKLFPPTLPACQ